MTEVDWADATELACRISDGSASAHDTLEAALDYAMTTDRSLRAVRRWFRVAEASVPSPADDRPFAGVPCLIKNLGQQAASEPYTAGNRLLAEHGNRATADSWSVARMRAAGFSVLGSTNVPEFGTSPATEPLEFGPTLNPWNIGRSPGGSSGGAAAAVAAGMVPVALASDGAGSCRMPASMCSVIGFKPTRGLISDGPHAGFVRFGFATNGIMARTTRDVAAVLDVLAGWRRGDPWRVLPEPQNYRALTEMTTEPLKVGLLTQPLGGVDLHAECRKAVEQTGTLLAELGHRVEPAHPRARFRRHRR